MCCTRLMHVWHWALEMLLWFLPVLLLVRAAVEAGGEVEGLGLRNGVPEGLRGAPKRKLLLLLLLLLLHLRTAISHRLLEPKPAPRMHRHMITARQQYAHNMCVSSVCFEGICMPARASTRCSLRLECRCRCHAANPNAGESEHEGKNLPPCISLVLLPRLLLLLRVHHFRIFLTHARLRAKGEAAPAVLIDHLPAQSSSTPTKTTFSLFQCKPCCSGWEGVHKITFPA